MSLYGIAKNAVKWFGDYFSKLAQCTLVNGHKSNFKPVNYGVPQGFTLGLTLFILYINDLFHYSSIDENKLIMYADDTVVFTSGSDEAKVTRDVQSLFNHIISWCDANKLTINEKKTKITVFNKKMPYIQTILFLEINCWNLLECTGTLQQLLNIYRI